MFIRAENFKEDWNQVFLSFLIDMFHTSCLNVFNKGNIPYQRPTAIVDSFYHLLNQTQASRFDFLFLLWCCQYMFIRAENFKEHWKQVFLSFFTFHTSCPNIFKKIVYLLAANGQSWQLLPFAQSSLPHTK